MARMGRPLVMAPEERKEAIYAAAEKMFCERGYEKVTMADIAQAASMSKKTLYTVFADKEDLLRNLVSSSYIWPDNAFKAQSTDPVDGLRLHLRVVANHVLSDRHINLSRLSIGESIGIKGLADTFLEMGIGRSRESLIQAIDRIDRQRFVVDLAPHHIAGMLYGATAGFALMNALLRGRTPDMERVYADIDEVVAKLFR